MLGDKLQEHIRHLVDIGCALSSERDLHVLLAKIVDEARRFTQADGGTLFLLNDTNDTLDWAIVQNESMGIRKGDGSDPLEDAVFRPIALYDDAGAPILSNVATYVAHRAEVVSIGDVYDESDEFDFDGPKRFDAGTGYRTKSMLVVPLLHFEGGVVGVLQLINALGDDGELIEFEPSFQDLTRSLASQAAVAIKNAELFEELELQFEAMIRSIAMAIDEKSPYTAGHVRRVVDVTMRIAEAIDRADDGIYADVNFSSDELKAMRIAAWMHDIGKIATPEWVVDKATKLHGLNDRIETVRERFGKMDAEARVRALEAKLSGGDTRAIDQALEAELEQIRDDLRFLENANLGKEFMSDEHVSRVNAIHEKGWITDDEAYNLSIRKGTLTHEEREIIKDHARVSYKMLTELPFSRHLSDVPEIAASHHEKLNGTGYPRGLDGSQLNLKARILAVADIFEALTAADRPYKQPTPLSGVLRILGFMIKDEELDPDVIAFAMRSGVFDRYAEAEVTPGQRDLVLRDQKI